MNESGDKPHYQSKPSSEPFGSSFFVSSEGVVIGLEGITIAGKECNALRTNTWL